LLEDVELIELPSLVKNVKIIDNKKLNRVSIKSCNSINKLLIYNSTLKDINLDNLPNLKSLNLSESKSLKEINI
jgi:Leucine-rich repeat (LRR) protein